MTIKLYRPVPAGCDVRLSDRTDDRATDIKISLSYAKGGLNYATYKTDARGYWLHVTPVAREVTPTATFERFAMFTGFKALLKDATRLDRKRLAAIFTLIESKADTLAANVAAGDQAGIAILIDQLRSAAVDAR